MAGGAIEAPAVHQALRAAASRTAALLRTPHDDPGTAVPHLAWTVGETAAHMVAELRHYTAFVNGERNAAAAVALPADQETPSGRSAAANATQLAEFTERDLSRLAGMMVPAGEDFIAAAGQRRAGEPIPTPNGLSMTTPTMATSCVSGAAPATSSSSTTAPR
jgi:hypothetical protein